jgi:hypothetical protein
LWLASLVAPPLAGTTRGLALPPWFLTEGEGQWLAPPPPVGVRGRRVGLAGAIRARIVDPGRFGIDY